MFWDILKKLCSDNNIYPNTVTKNIGLPGAIATKWKNGATPTIDKLNAIADYFNVSVDYLLGREKPSVPPENFTAQEQEFIFQFRKLSLAEQADVAKKLYKNGEKQ